MWNDRENRGVYGNCGIFFVTFHGVGNRGAFIVQVAEIKKIFINSKSAVPEKMWISAHFFRNSVFLYPKSPCFSSSAKSAAHFPL